MLSFGQLCDLFGNVGHYSAAGAWDCRQFGGRCRQAILVITKDQSSLEAGVMMDTQEQAEEAEWEVGMWMGWRAVDSMKMSLMRVCQGGFLEIQKTAD
mmetsp:Transcript_1080/g.2154  ORF Transcript_1080/g.2154 Transcript_1080/m.2154 type:complete len:98 (+) Transcript_1080:8-301(+)|eukprot:CAMPEP_0201877754 /NCGR_PEP_ID=MMETSP0902-20130614/9096_1 /ASSEMBLY_ACC=CAM_ASM_000551 /TAXON_ID=420261 /ORGANISM="Thalassiosira antarctica, Strain CCMP982" /LENGTH=97 /DNA_ID=CAMNT_0048405267 /DNA_START=1488 /DNA_END=1781 /DNA_ORIENTATION=+